MMCRSIQLRRKTRRFLRNCRDRITPLMEGQMQRTSRVWKRMAVVALLGLGGGIVNAQDPSDTQMMTAERSWQLQSVLQSIDADRETWVNLLVSKWSAVLNPAVYNPASYPGSVARAARAWRLDGACLARDCLTASDDLRGRRNDVREPGA